MGAVVAEAVLEGELNVERYTKALFRSRGRVTQSHQHRKPKAFSMVADTFLKESNGPNYRGWGGDRDGRGGGPPVGNWTGNQRGADNWGGNQRGGSNWNNGADNRYVISMLSFF